VATWRPTTWILIAVSLAWEPLGDDIAALAGGAEEGRMALWSSAGVQLAGKCDLKFEHVVSSRSLHRSLILLYDEVM
jgi:hypothetical protein